MNTFTKSVLGACLVLLITLCAALVSNNVCGNAQIGDLTEQKIYTLSDGTKTILSKLNRKVTLKFFYTLSAARKLPEDARWLNNYYLYVKDLLSEYEELGNGNIEIKFLDPKRYSDEEEEARKFNIRFYQGDRPLCLGLVAETEFGKAKVLPQLHPMRQQFLEYEITKSIADLMEREKRTIGVISSLPVTGSDMNPYMMMMMQQQGKKPPQAWGLIKYLKKSYDVRKIEVGDTATISDDIDSLMVIHPKSLDEKTLFAIDQYAMGGGSLIVLADPLCYADAPKQPTQMGMPPPPHDSSSNLNALLKKWGVTMSTDKLVLDRALTQKRDKYPPLLQLTGPTAEDENGCFSKEFAFSESLKELRVLGAGELTLNDDAPGKVSPVAFTTATGSTWKPKVMSQAGRTPPKTILEESKDGTEPVVVACMINGAIESNYPDGIEVTIGGARNGPPKPGDKPPVSKKLEAVKEAKEAKILVVADVDPFSDLLGIRFDPRNPGYYMMQSRNHELIENALEFLGGNAELLKVRSRASVMKRFEKYDEMDRIAAKETGEKEKEMEEQIKKAREELKNLKVNSLEELKNELTTKQEELDAKIYTLTKDQRGLMAGKDKAKEALQSKLLLINVLVAPVVLVLIAIGLALYRLIRAKHYIANRQED
jgi:ABC-2 type transport system permease protein